MPEQLVLREDNNAVSILTLNTPATLNALSNAMLDAVQTQLDALETDTSIKVVILRGSGRAFCAGHDLKEMTAARQTPDRGHAAFQDLFAKCAKMMMTLPRLPQPVIAQVHGIATAAGCQLVASCDMAVAAEGTRFGVNGVNIGLFCSTPMVALSRAMPRKKTFEMLTTGRFINAAEAEALGLINQVASDIDLSKTTMDLAQLIASKLSSAVRVGKRAFYEQMGMPLTDAYAHTGEVMAANMMQDDTVEGIQAFIEKRPPKWD